MTVPDVTDGPTAASQVLRVAIVDDDPFVLQALRAYLSSDERIEVTSTFSRAADALAQAICHGWRGGGTGTDDATEMVSAGGAVRVSARTPAQRQWAPAQAAARRTGAVDPRRVRR